MITSQYVVGLKRTLTVGSRGIDSGLVPMIRIGNSFLRKFNFDIGDVMEVEYSLNKITITKINPMTDAKT